MPCDKMKFENSLKHYEESLNVIPMGTSTFSKNPNLFVIGTAPLYLKSAKGCRVYDLDGNEFIDYSMALGPVILGYADPEVNAAAKAGIDEGFIYTLSVPEEALLAKKLIEIIPCAEMVRFSKNGSDVCEAAVKLARHYTNKLKIITIGYHGFHDWFIAATDRNKGIPSVLSEWVLPHDYNDLAKIEDTIRSQHGEIAALMMEPVINYEADPGFLQNIRALTQQYNIVLIFDEMKTGFRLHLGGGQKYFNVIPDLAVFAKALSNGFPLSALTGKTDLMKQFEDESCFFSASYATEKTSLLAALKTIEILQRDAVLAHNWEMGEMLKNGVQKILQKHALEDAIQIVGYPVMSHFVVSDYEKIKSVTTRSFIQEECVKRGILFVGYHHPCFSHKSADIQKTLEVYDEVFSLVKQGFEAQEMPLQGKSIGGFGVRK